MVLLCRIYAFGFYWAILFYDKNNNLIQQCGFGPNVPSLENYDNNRKFNTESKYPVTAGYKRYATFTFDSYNKVPAGTYKTILRLGSQAKNNTAIVTNLNVILSL